jgi:hypothetical protein
MTMQRNDMELLERLKDEVAHDKIKIVQLQEKVKSNELKIAELERNPPKTVDVVEPKTVVVEQPEESGEDMTSSSSAGNVRRRGSLLEVNKLNTKNTQVLLCLLFLKLSLLTCIHTHCIYLCICTGYVEVFGGRAHSHGKHFIVHVRQILSLACFLFGTLVAFFFLFFLFI